MVATIDEWADAYMCMCSIGDHLGRIEYEHGNSHHGDSIWLHKYLF